MFIASDGLPSQRKFSTPEPWEMIQFIVQDGYDHTFITIKVTGNSQVQSIFY